MANSVFRDGITLRVIRNDFPQITAGMVKAADRACKKTAFDIEAGAKVRAPVDTGNLKGSIGADRVKEAHYRITVGAHYGAYVEYGTYRMAAQPYFMPAFNAAISYFETAMRQIFAGHGAR